MARVRNLFSVVIASGVIAASGASFNLAGETKFEIAGRIETMRKGNEITVLFARRPVEKRYYIVNGSTVQGLLDILTVVPVDIGLYRYRAVAVYMLSNKIYSRLIRAGSDIGLAKSARPLQGEVTESVAMKEKSFRKKITAEDGMEMLLVPAGKFVFGTSGGDRDESPEQTIYLDAYYIDRYEVTNGEYQSFTEAANARPPLSWEKGRFDRGEEKLPVLVTYHEAEAYARWYHKRLPTEQEWEKAARGVGRLPGGEGANYLYPWGNRFDSEKVNCADFWQNGKTGEHLKIRFRVAAEGLMPARSFEPEGASPYGVVNMSGNAAEWTSSWYMPYKGNRSKQGREFRRYGKQYKVVRGGSWHSQRYRVRVTSREIGGTPNLHTDNLAGFRCVRDTAILDVNGQ